MISISSIRQGYRLMRMIVDEEEDLSLGMFQSKPYCLYWNRPFYEREGFQITNSLGYRFMGKFDPDFQTNPSIKVLILGGSTTFSDFHSNDYKDTWAFNFALNLARSLKHEDISIYNAGLNAGLSSELLSRFVFDFESISPDLVILHGPGNDMLPVLIGDETRDYELTRRVFQFGKRPGERFIVSKLAILQLIYTLWFSRIPASFLNTPTMPSISEQIQQIESTDLYQYRLNVSALVRLSKSIGSKLLLVDFLQAPLPKLKEIWPELAVSAISCVSKMNEVLQSQSTNGENQVFYLKLKVEDFRLEYFLDNCHLTTEGEHKKALIISDFVIANHLV
jgi:hypothetical protein